MSKIDINRYLVDEATFDTQLSPTEWNRAISIMVEQILKPKGYGHNLVQNVANATIRREQEASTAMGKGFALPHTKTSLVKDAYVGWFSVGAGIDFNALDHQPVYILCCIVSPSSESLDLHLTIMESVFFCALQSDFRKNARQASTAHEFRLAVLTALRKRDIS